MKILPFSKTLLTPALLVSLCGFLRAADVAGTWKAEFDGAVGHLIYTYDFKQDGEKLTGRATRDAGDQKSTNDISGKVTGNDISFNEDLKVQDQELQVDYTGKVDGDEMKLSRKVGEFATNDIVAKRVREIALPALTGKWLSEFDTQVGHQKYAYEFKQDGDKITGSATRDVNDEKTTNDITGKITGTEITFTEPLKVQDQDIQINYTGKIDGDEIKLTRKVGELATNEIVANREKLADAKPK